ncbi:hypothetical protein BH24ACT8_BH24ACT8_21740 [soil metagenome]
MTWLDLTLAVVGLTGVLLALVSEPMQRRLPVTEPLVALGLGVLAGPAVLGLVTVEAHLRDQLLLEGSRVLLAASVMAAALRYPASSLTGLSALALGLPAALALLFGACLAPTDPVLAASVVTGGPAERTLAERVRAILTIESGANDGLGLVLVGLCVAAVLPAQGIGHALGLVAWDVLAGVAIGAALGWLAGWGLRWAVEHHDLGEGPELVYTLLLALGVLGVARLADTGGVLAVFVAGLVYSRIVPGAPRRQQVAVDEGINRYAVIPLFLLLGAVLPWAAWRDLGWMGVLFVLGVLVLRRPPALLALARPLGVTVPQAGFMGWFGPMGVSALFYLAHARHEGVQDPTLFAAVTLAVTVSVVVFGLTASPGRRLYAARHGSDTAPTG